MRVHYDIHQQRKIQGELDLDLEEEEAWEDAGTDYERQAVIEAAVAARARPADWVYGRQVDFGIVPEDEE